MNRLRGKGIFLSIWWSNNTYDVKKGYTPRTEETMKTLRVGSFCIAWEWLEES